MSEKHASELDIHVPTGTVSFRLANGEWYEVNASASSVCRVMTVATFSTVHTVEKNPETLVLTIKDWVCPF